MKRNLKYFIMIFLISVLLGFLFGRKMKDNDIATENLVTQNVIIGNMAGSEKILETSFQEERINANTKLILKKYYLDCNHSISRDVELPSELINMTKEQIEEAYSDWNVERFSNKEVILYKKVYGLCEEHFIIKSGEEFIEVYSLNEDYDKELYEVTNISTEYLTEEDLNKLEEGIYVYGVAELNSILESFE